MTIDWNVIATMASPIVALFIGAALDRALLNRPRVVSYLGHVSGIALHRNENPITVNTHSIVIRNAGRWTATNVRVGHNFLPDFQVFPDTDYHVSDLPGGGKEICFPKLVPDKQVTITYLYFPPVTWQQVNTHAESDDGPVKIIHVLPTAQPPKWALRVLWFLVGFGTLAVVYALYALVVWLV